MQNHKENFQTFDENALFEVAIISVLGDREEQQDSVGYEIKSDEGMVVVCDGMGGHNGGGIASSIAVNMLIKRYLDAYPGNFMHQIIIDTIEDIDRKIASLTDNAGELMKAGSTIATVFINGKNLYWTSVGDSRIYIFRNGELVQATEDHTYKTILDEKKEQGLISDLEYQIESRQGEALVSFLGINGIPKIDANENAFSLLTNDKILLMSDGLYKVLTNDEIGRILLNFSNIEDALKALEIKVQKAAKHGNVVRDNMTVALIKIK